jgi:hypothetical protein
MLLQTKGLRAIVSQSIMHSTSKTRTRSYFPKKPGLHNDKKFYSHDPHFFSPAAACAMTMNSTMSSRRVGDCK